jgi:propanediol dehydratase small subunit
MNEKSIGSSCCSFGENKTAKDIAAAIKDLDSGVLIELNSLEIKKSDMEKSIESCNTGKCDCLSKSQKERIESISLKEDSDGKLSIEIKGDITKDEIRTTMEKAMRNQSC